MNRATKLRNTERLRTRRITASGLRWYPGLRAPVHRAPPRLVDCVETTREVLRLPVTGGNGRLPVTGGTTAFPAQARRLPVTGGPATAPVPAARLPVTARIALALPRRPDELENQIFQRAAIRSCRTAVSAFATFFVALALAAGVLGGWVDPARAQVSWLNAEDGDILNVSSADGPPPGLPFLQVRHSTETSEERGTMVLNRMRVLYHVTPHVSVGVSALHLDQKLGILTKRGLGDTNLSLKIHYAPWPDQPFRIGLRQTLSLPTGYEKEMDGLTPFTSRQNDYSAQLLAQYVTPGFAAYANPGLLLPGGKADSYATGGLGVAFQAPLGFHCLGDYYTRLDLVTRKLESETYIGVRHNLLFGLGVQGGMKRRLLTGEGVDPEFQLGLTLGRDQPKTAQLYAFRERADTGLLVHSVQSTFPDPFGLGREFSESFRAEPVGGKTQPVVYITSTAEAPPPSGAVPVPRASEWVATLATPRNYELNVKILEFLDAEIGGLDLSPLARVARARTTVVGQCELIAPDGYSVLSRKLYQGRASKILGVELAPESGSLASTQAPDELRGRLRRAAVRDLMRRVRDDAIQTIQMRDYR